METDDGGIISGIIGLVGGIILIVSVCPIVWQVLSVSSSLYLTHQGQSSSQTLISSMPQALSLLGLRDLLVVFLIVASIFLLFLSVLRGKGQ